MTTSWTDTMVSRQYCKTFAIYFLINSKNSHWYLTATTLILTRSFTICSHENAAVSNYHLVGWEITMTENHGWWWQLLQSDIGKGLLLRRHIVGWNKFMLWLHSASQWKQTTLLQKTSIGNAADYTRIVPFKALSFVLQTFYWDKIFHKR